MLGPYASAETPEHKEQIVQQFLPRVKYYANRYAFGLPAGLTVEDLVSAGIVGLLEALSRFDPSLKVTLSTFADFRIRGAIIDEVRSMQWASKDVKKKIEDLRRAYDEIEREMHRTATDDEVASRMKISMEELHKILATVNTVKMVNLEDLGINQDGEALDILECITSGDDTSILDDLGLREMQSALGRVIDELPEKERQVVTLYYYEELTMKEIGKVLGITESRVCQLHGKAILKLKKGMDEFRG